MAVKVSVWETEDFYLGAFADEARGIEVQEETFARWQRIEAEWRAMQTELATLYHARAVAAMREP
jgi:hypothetical protein